MVDDVQNPPHRPSGGSLRPGECVRIVRGELGGLSGKVGWLRNNRTYVLTMDEWEPGVYVEVDQDSVERVVG